MRPEEAKARLKEFQLMDTNEQMSYAREIEEAFRIFWSYGPTEEEFSGHMERILLTARMLHIALMGRHG